MRQLDFEDLHDYQQKGVELIIDNPKYGLLLDMGLGKTVTTLTAIHRLHYWDLSVDKVLIIAPLRVARDVWTDEVNKWAHLKGLTVSKVMGTEKQRVQALKEKAQVYTISRDNVAWLCSHFNYVLPFDMVVVDESSSFKNPKSMRFKALRRAIAGVPRVIVLTGTPAPNGLIDLWAQIYLLDKGERLGKTVTTYREQYFKPDKRNGHIVYNYKIADGSEEAIYDAIKDISVSMKAKDYIKLPECSYIDVPIQMTPEVKKDYETFERDSVLQLIESDAEINAMNAAVLSMKLRQYANGALYDEQKNVHEVHTLKLEALEELVESAGGQPILVAWQFRHDVERLKAHFKSLKPRELKSSQDLIDWNNGEIQMLLVHPASAGHGLNLQAGGHIIVWFGLDWSLELYQQLNTRLFRQGQKNAVMIYRLILKGTDDERVLEALESKDARQERLLEALKAKIRKYSNK